MKECILDARERGGLYTSQEKPEGPQEAVGDSPCAVSLCGCPFRQQEVRDFTARLIGQLWHWTSIG
jgi:hypothetical protein